MKKYILTALMATAALTLISTSGYAADDGFGGSTYFTAQTPDALGDTPTGNALAAKMDDDASAVSQIEPAAGGENYGVFTLPEEPSTPPAHKGEILNTPDKPIVPGQTVTGTAQ